MGATRRSLPPEAVAAARVAARDRPDARPGKRGRPQVLQLGRCLRAERAQHHERLSQCRPQVAHRAEQSRSREFVKSGTALTLRLKLAHPPTAPLPVTARSVGVAASPAGCYPLSDEGTRYEPGEYCRDSDQGTTSMAGNGESIICENNDGLRW